MANAYSATAKAACASAAAKVAIQLATGSTVTARVVAFDVTFDGTTATNTPILVEWVKTTAASSGGSTYTPLKYNADGQAVAANVTARINDTTDGTSPTIISSWEVPPTSGMSYQFPLGRELFIPASAFYEIRLTTASGSGTPNYAVNVVWEE